MTGETEDGVLRIKIANPGRRNAFTWQMYDQLQALLEGVHDDPQIRVVTLEGSVEEGFAAGTDIGQFVDFRTGRDGVAYERRVGEVVRTLLSVPVPIVAQVQGAAVGAGLVLRRLLRRRRGGGGDPVSEYPSCAPSATPSLLRWWPG